MSQLSVHAPTKGAPATSKDVQEWERKQRAREYRVAARREKRNRKADEKKQRKLNATILRRMTRNPDKYNKNAERNRSRAIELERRKIWQQAVQQAQHLAAIHDPSGASFNVSPVVKLENGIVITQEAFKRRQERQAEKAVKEKAGVDGVVADGSNIGHERQNVEASESCPDAGINSMSNGLHPDRVGRVEVAGDQQPARNVSKKQQKKLALFEPRPPPPKPTIPAGVSIPEGEENWLELWDLTEEQAERRVAREKKRKAAERKALRVKQQSGKAERRAARDEKRMVYRDIKLEWKEIKAEQTRERTKMRSIEDEESKKIAVRINIMERQAALNLCASLGFTTDNTPGTDDIIPKALGMKGVDVDFDAIEKADRQGDIRPKQSTSKNSSKRVDLAAASRDAKTQYVSTGNGIVQNEGDEFIKLDVGDGQDFQALNYNHKLRRKLRRAIDNAEIQKELLVRARAIQYFKDREEEVPEALVTPSKPVNEKGHRILDNGKLETSKQERVRSRMELTEFNMQMKVLRKQAKEAAIYAGLKKHAVLTGKIKESSDQEKANHTDGHEEMEMTGATPISSSIIVQGRGTKRSLSASENTSTDEDSEQKDSDATSVAEESSDYTDSASSASKTISTKRRKLSS